MTKPKRGSKFAAIKAAILALPEAAPADIIKVVKADANLKVSTASVQRVKQKLAGTLPPSIAKRATKTTAPTLAMNVDGLIAVKNFAPKVGGLDALISLAQTLKAVA